MKHIRNLRKLRLRMLKHCERGATAIEYAMIVAMISLGVLGAMSLVAEKTINMWGNVTTAVTSH